MTETLSGLAERVVELRSAFDRGFAVPPRADAAAKQDLLAIRVGAEPCAVRLSEVSGLFVDRWITRIPATEAALIGIAGFRGAIVPVYSLSAVLGHSGTQPTRWLVIAAAAAVALAFDSFEGHMRVPAHAILPQQPNAQMRSLAPDFVRITDAVRPILHLAAIVGALGTPGSPGTAVS
jgi:chemotaxis signal transduction protein